MGLGEIFKNGVEATKDFFIDKGKILLGKISESKVGKVVKKIFEKAHNMLKTVIEKLEKKIRGVILGATHFFRKIGNKYQEGTKNYSVNRETREWKETTVTRQIESGDLPPQYQTMEEEFEIDDSRAIDEALVY